MIQGDFEIANLTELSSFAAAMARLLTPGLTIALHGTLGAGKTALVRELAESLGVARESVVSPTFVLCQEYPGRIPIIHVDAYRLSGGNELLDLEPDALFAPTNVTIIEWAERVASALPADRLEITIEVVTETARSIRVEGHGVSAVEVVTHLTSAWRSSPSKPMAFPVTASFLKQSED